MSAISRAALALAALSLASCADHCERTMAEYCASGGCPSAPDDRSALCLPGAWVHVQTCGDYVVADQSGVDTGTDYYFDARTHELVAAINWSANFGGSETCAAGPDFFDRPDCPLDTHATSICPDSGFP